MCPVPHQVRHYLLAARPRGEGAVARREEVVVVKAAARWVPTVAEGSGKGRFVTVSGGEGPALPKLVHSVRTRVCAHAGAQEVRPCMSTAEMGPVCLMLLNQHFSVSSWSFSAEPSRPALLLQPLSPFCLQFC